MRKSKAIFALVAGLFLILFSSLAQAEVRERACPLMDQLQAISDNQDRTQLDTEFQSSFDSEHARPITEIAKDLDEDGNPYGLSVDEFAALESLTQADYDWINSALRSCDSELPKWRTFIFEVSSALKKLPDHAGLVYRSIRTFAGKTAEQTMAMFDDHQKNAVVTYYAFTSAAPDQGAMAYYYGPVLLKIYSKHGKAIERYAVHRGEHEILFDRNSKFKVLQREPKTHPNRLIITLEEL